MNENKICFITCVNDEKKYKEALWYIKKLNIPQGYEIEAIAIKDAPYITRAYNHAMLHTDAKYKVYLHQDVSIIYNDFIIDFIEIFKNNPKLGMLGVAGSKNIPDNVIWWESEEKDIVLKVCDNANRGNLFVSKSVNMNFENDYEKVKCIDGLIMITQYDVLWREDIFKAWHFYDISQSFEFIKQGYEVGVPKQKQVWCVHNCGNPSGKGYFENRDIFVQEYFKEGRNTL
jgi:hypothetical protein